MSEFKCLYMNCWVSDCMIVIEGWIELAGLSEVWLSVCSCLVVYWWWFRYCVVVQVGEFQGSVVGSWMDELWLDCFMILNSWTVL